MTNIYMALALMLGTGLPGVQSGAAFCSLGF